MAMPGAGTIVVGSIFVILALLVSRAMAKKPSPTNGRLVCDPSPYKFVDADILASIEAEIAAGQTDRVVIATNVATEHFGKHPNGDNVVFPPQGTPPQGVQCVWDRVLELIDRQLVDQPTGPVVFTAHGALDPGYPWPEPSIHRGQDGSHYPTPGMFWIINHANAPKDPQGRPEINTLSEGAKAILGAAITMANARGQGPTTLDFALAGSPQKPYKDLRMQVIKYLLNDWNWRLYAQTNANLAGGVDPGKGGVGCNDNNVRDAGAQRIDYMMCGGHGLNWCPRHADNIQRLASQGLRPKRTTSEAGKSLGGGNSNMQLWVPAFDLNGLRAAVPVIRTIANPHPGWADTINPPPAVWNRGIEGAIGGSCPGIPHTA